MKQCQITVNCNAVISLCLREYYEFINITKTTILAKYCEKNISYFSYIKSLNTIKLFYSDSSIVSTLTGCNLKINLGDEFGKTTDEKKQLTTKNSSFEILRVIFKEITRRKKKL